jgi:hypothetical protein
LIAGPPVVAKGRGRAEAHPQRGHVRRVRGLDPARRHRGRRRALRRSARRRLRPARRARGLRDGAAGGPRPWADPPGRGEQGRTRDVPDAGLRRGLRRGAAGRAAAGHGLRRLVPVVSAAASGRVGARRRRPDGRSRMPMARACRRGRATGPRGAPESAAGPGAPASARSRPRRVGATGGTARAGRRIARLRLSRGPPPGAGRAAGGPPLGTGLSDEARRVS